MKRPLYVQMNQGFTGQKRIVRRNGNTVTFSEKRDFERFVKNLELLNTIQHSSPKSIYALAKIEKKDVANVAKIVLFYEKMGVLKMKFAVVSGRKIKTPFVEYDQIIFEIRKPRKTTSAKAMLGLVRRR